MIIGKKTNKALKEQFAIAKPIAKLTQGDMIRLLREKNELSQNQLAQMTGLTQSTISALENNRIKLGIERAKVLAKILHVHPGVLAFPDWEDKSVA